VLRDYLKSNSVQDDRLAVLKLPDDAWQLSDFYDSDVVIDYSSELSLSYQQFKALTAQGKRYFKDTQSSRTSMTRLKEDEGDWFRHIEAICKAFAWEERLLVSDTLGSGAEKLNFFMNREASLSNVRLLVSRVLRPTGVKPLFVVSGEALANNFLAVLKEYRIDSGYSLGDPINYTVSSDIEISIVKSPIITVKKDIVWYDGSSKVPPNQRLTYKDCPFPEEWKGTSSSGQMTSFWIFGGLALSVGLVSAFVFLRYYCYVTVIDVPTPILLSTQDMLVFLCSLLSLCSS
jgi:hypothetical protein